MKLLSNYRPLFDKKTPRYTVVTGGRGSAKSFHIATLLLNLTYIAGHVILFTRWTMVSAHISIIPEFLEKIESMNVQVDFKISKNEIVNIKTGSRIVFKGIKTSQGTATANLKSIQGVTTWVLDEAEELTDESIFDKIDFSIREPNKNNRIILILNPTTKEHFIYKRFFEQAGVEAGYNGVSNDTQYIHTTYQDNIENLSDSFIARAEQIKENNPDKYNHVMLGGWLNRAEGVVFTNWKYGTFNPDQLQTSFGMDFGFSVDPDTLVEVAIDKKKKIIYVKEHLYKRALQLDALAWIVKNKAGNSLIIADSAEPRLISDLKQRQINIKPIQKTKIEFGITLMLDYTIVVEENSSNIAKELNNFTYIDKGSKLYIDDYNHGLDSIRYNVTYHLDKSNKRPDAFIY